MTPLARRLAGLLVAEPAFAGAGAHAAPRSRPAPRAVALPARLVVVVGDVGGLARSVAGRMSRSERRPVLLVDLTGRPPVPSPLPPLTTTARAASRLRAAGHPATASGRVVTVIVGGDSAAALSRLQTAWADGSTVVAFSARDEVADAALAASDLAVIATPAAGPAGLAAAAVVGLDEVASSVCSVGCDPAATHRPWRHRAALSVVSRSLR